MNNYYTLIFHLYKWKMNRLNNSEGSLSTSISGIFTGKNVISAENNHRLVQKAKAGLGIAYFVALASVMFVLFS